MSIPSPSRSAGPPARRTEACVASHGPTSRVVGRACTRLFIITLLYHSFTLSRLIIIISIIIIPLSPHRRPVARGVAIPRFLRRRRSGPLTTFITRSTPLTCFIPLTRSTLLILYHPGQVDDDEVFDSKFLREYIAQARQKQPHVPHELTEYVVGAYVR